MCNQGFNGHSLSSAFYSGNSLVLRRGFSGNIHINKVLLSPRVIKEKIEIDCTLQDILLFYKSYSIIHLY